MTALLHIDDLHITVLTANGPRPVVKGVSLSLERGSSLALVGESGSGKTLTCRTILGRTPERATVSGKVLFDGRDVLRLRGNPLRVFRAREVALISQDPHAAIGPVVRIGAFLTEQLTAHRRVPSRDAWARAKTILRELGFPEPDRIMRAYPHMLSGGMLQRVVIASALLAEPELIIADEATSALDVTNQAEVARTLRRLANERGLTLIFVTHDLDLAAATSDRVAVMLDGSLVDCQPSATIYEAPGHPYTAALAACRPRLDIVQRPLPTVADFIPPGATQ